MSYKKVVKPGIGEEVFVRRRRSEKAERERAEWEYLPLSLTSGRNWRALAFVPGTLDAKRDGVWKHTKRARPGRQRCASRTLLTQTKGYFYI